MLPRAAISTGPVDENRQPWTSTLPTLQLLYDRRRSADERVRRAVAMVRDNCRWEYDDEPFFQGEAGTLHQRQGGHTRGTTSGQDMRGLFGPPPGEQLEDGGWNCEAERGSVRGSFHTTINVLECLLAHGAATGGSPESNAAQRRGEEYLLERDLPAAQEHL